MTRIEGPERLVAWWKSYRKVHPSFPFEISYHPRSDEHSKILCAYVLEDLVSSCDSLRQHALRGEVCYELNHEVWRRDGTKKLLDLVIGQPAESLTGEGIRRGKVMTPGIRIAIEAKACMTKHRSAMPRLRDELVGSMGSAVEANPQAVVGGVVVVNIADQFLSPTHQPDPVPRELARLRRRKHNQPKDAASVVEALGKLPFRKGPPDVGFDSLGIIVVYHDNDVGSPRIELRTDDPCPPATSPRSSRSYVIDMGNKYRVRFGS